MTMLLETIFAPFVKERPICVMARGTLERLLDAQRLDTLFARTAQQQYTRELLFSSLVQLMSEVVLGVHPTVHAAYQANRAAIGVSTTALYNKLDRPWYVTLLHWRSPWSRPCRPATRDGCPAIKSRYSMAII